MNDVDAGSRTVAEDAVDLVWSRGEVDRIPEFYTDDFRAHQPRPALNWTGAPENLTWSGHDGVRNAVLAVRAAFPDYVEAPELVVSQGGFIAMRMRNTGTHDGTTLDGSPVTGKRIDVTDTMFVRLEGGRIAEQWGLLDELSVARQLGRVTLEGSPVLSEPVGEG